MTAQAMVGNPPQQAPLPSRSLPRHACGSACRGLLMSGCTAWPRLHIAVDRREPQDAHCPPGLAGCSGGRHCQVIVMTDPREGM